MLTIFKLNSHNAPTKLWNAESSRMMLVSKSHYHSLNTLRIKVCQKWMCHMLPRLLPLLLQLLLPIIGYPFS